MPSGSHLFAAGVVPGLLFISQYSCAQKKKENNTALMTLAIEFAMLNLLVLELNGRILRFFS